MELISVAIRKPDEVNLILGQSHFIKTVEDLHEALVGAVPGIKFGLAFCEASGPALVRWSGTDEQLTDLARRTMLELGAGHAFLILLRQRLSDQRAARGARRSRRCAASTAPPPTRWRSSSLRPAKAGPSSGWSTASRSRGIESEAEIAERKADAPPLRVQGRLTVRRRRSPACPRSRPGQVAGASLSAR